MSLLSWATIFSKAWTFWRIRQSAPALHAFWQAPNLIDASALLVAADVEQIYAPLAQQAIAVVNIDNNGDKNTLAGEGDVADALTRVLRLQIQAATARLESGLTLLASIGATAPFVGLLGTVWGIYHALSNVAASGTVQIDQVAGPVGEALIMTAIGLVVAIPAVLAYNALNRFNRITAAELDGFAFDLHAHLSKK